jgi:16S rRNA processing protein RimM
MPEPQPQFLVVGRIVAPWGTGGEVKVEVMTDFPERFTPSREVYLDGSPLAIERARPHQGYLVVKLASIDSIPQAEELRGRYLEIPSTQATPLPPGQYYRFQVIGLEVWTEGGDFLGKVADILLTGSNDVYLVRGRYGEVLVPAIEDVVKVIDLDTGRLIIEAIPGLIESGENGPGPQHD